MHPIVWLWYLPEVCMVTPSTTHFSQERFSWREVAFIPTTLDERELGKQLKHALQAAVSLTHPSVAVIEPPDWEWVQQQHRRFESALLGSMVLKNKRWLIYCGNDCSPQLDFLLPAQPPDSLAGTAFLRLYDELKLLRDTHPA